jgi:hypothetical protein
MTSTEAQRERLPKWAQEELRILEMRVEEWRTKALIGPDDSNTFVASGLDDAKPLGRDPHIEYRLGPGRDNVFTVSLRGDDLYVSTDGRAQQALHVIPIVSNVIRCRMGEF